MKIGLEYDGDLHFSERQRFTGDISRHETLSHLSWLIIRVFKEHSRAFTLHRIHEAFRRRGPAAKSAKGS